MMVTDTSGHHLVNRENIEKEGKFAFTTDKDDIFEICFISRVPSNVRGSRQEVGTSFTPDTLMTSFWWFSGLSDFNYHYSNSNIYN